MIRDCCESNNTNYPFITLSGFNIAFRVQRLYSLGVRRIGVTTLPPTGCLPVAITLFGRGRNNCVVRLNKDALAFNKKLNATSQDLVEKFPDLKLVVFDIYNPLLKIITKPVENGIILTFDYFFLFKVS